MNELTASYKELIAHHRKHHEEEDKLHAELDEWTEREAAICPEDVGFDEYITRLQKQLADLRVALDEAREVCEDCASYSAKARDWLEKYPSP